MILELDCGNSFIKWRVIEAHGSTLVAEGIADSDRSLMTALQKLQPGLRHCRLVSVRSEDETESLVRQLADCYGIAPVCAVPMQMLAGVSNGYEEYQRLGLDRWLALVGGFHLARGNCVVIDAGTAVTSDLVTADGQHLGGFICPGLSLMRSPLRTHTRKIRYDEQSAARALRSLEPGRSTAEAVERGCSLMLQGFVLTQVNMARELWGDDFSLYLAGGDAEQLLAVVPGARWVPDLVFVGLAIACPLA